MRIRIIRVGTAVVAKYERESIAGWGFGGGAVVRLLLVLFI